MYILDNTETNLDFWVLEIFNIVIKLNLLVSYIFILFTIVDTL